MRLVAALLTEAEADSGDEFVEAFFQYESLKVEQCQQALSTIARTAQDEPGRAAGAHRAVAADRNACCRSRSGPALPSTWF